MLRLVLGLIILGLPASLLVLRLSLDRRKDRAGSTWSDMPRRAAVVLVVGYAVWWLLFLWASVTRPQGWLVGLLVAGPILGILKSVLGLVISFFARKREKWMLLAANSMFLLLSIFSIIPPN